MSGKSGSENGPDGFLKSIVMAVLAYLVFANIFFTDDPALVPMFFMMMAWFGAGLLLNIKGWTKNVIVILEIGLLIWLDRGFTAAGYPDTASQFALAMALGVYAPWLSRKVSQFSDFLNETETQKPSTNNSVDKTDEE